MAFMNQEKKKKIAAELKKVMPKGIKYTLRVQHHSAIVMTIQSAHINLLENVQWSEFNTERNYAQVTDHSHCIEESYKGEAREIIEGAFKALNTDNFDHSDSMADYFHVGHYVYLNIGTWEKPFVVKGASEKKPAEETKVSTMAFAEKFARSFSAALAG